MNCALSDGQEYGTFHDGLTLLDGDAGDGAGIFGLDVVLHLHGLKHEYDVADIDLLTNLNLDFCNRTRQRGLDG